MKKKMFKRVLEYVVMTFVAVVSLMQMNTIKVHASSWYPLPFTVDGVSYQYDYPTVETRYISEWNENLLYCTVCGHSIAATSYGDWSLTRTNFNTCLAAGHVRHPHYTGTKHNAAPGTCKTKATIEWYSCYYSCSNKLDSDGNVLTSIEGELDPTNHEGEPKWTKTASTHKKAYECCGEIVIAEADHSYGTTGASRYTCSVCEYVDTTKKADAELTDAKEAAKVAIDDAVAGDETANVVSAASTAKSNIDTASTLADVATAKTNGIAAIATAKGENALSAAKSSALTAIDEAVGGDTTANVVDAANSAKDAISGATTVDAVTTAEADGITAIQNIKAVNDVTEKIDAIGKVAYTSACKEKIDAARDAYDALSDDLKSQITNYDKLTDAEKVYPTLKPSGSSDSKSEEPAKEELEVREALEESMSVSPVTVDMTQLNKADAPVVPGTTYNLSNFVTTPGIVRGINAAVAASNKSGSNTATIYSGKPLCFNNAIVKAIQNGKKTVVYYFPYKGHIYSVTIPATVQARYVLERSGFAGPFYVGQQLGTTRLVK